MIMRMRGLSIAARNYIGYPELVESAYQMLEDYAPAGSKITRLPEWPHRFVGPEDDMRKEGCDLAEAESVLIMIEWEAPG